jgi:glutamate racemase
MTARRRQIAMYDSGLGGLTVLTALRRAIPDVDIVYAADTARVPYGDRPLEEVARFAGQIIRHLETYEPALLVIACGTSCSAFDRLGVRPSALPTLAIVDCGVTAAVAATRGGPIGVIATKATIGSGIFERKIHTALPGAAVISVAAPALVPLIESECWDTDQARAEVRTSCIPFAQGRVDTLVLGCTHYPLLRRWFERELDPRVALVDPADECARQAAAMLEPLRPGEGALRFEVSGDVDRFARDASALAGVRAKVEGVNFSDQAEDLEDHKSGEDAERDTRQDLSESVGAQIDASPADQRHDGGVRQRL